MFLGQHVELGFGHVAIDYEDGRPGVLIRLDAERVQHACRPRRVLRSRFAAMGAAQRVIAPSKNPFDIMMIFNNFKTGGQEIVPRPTSNRGQDGRSVVFAWVLGRQGAT